MMAKKKSDVKKDLLKEHDMIKKELQNNPVDNGKELSKLMDRLEEIGKRLGKLEKAQKEPVIDKEYEW